MTIWKDERHGGAQWKVRMTSADGRRIQRSFSTKRQAEDFELEERNRRQAARAGMTVRRENITFGTLAHIWEQNFPASSWKLAMLKHSTDRWGDTPVRAIEPEAVGAWLHGLDKAPKTKTHILGVLRQVLNAGVEWGYLHRSPARPGAFQAPGSQRLSPIRPFESWADVMAVARALPLDGALVRFVCATGLRSPSEWDELRWGHVDLRGRTLLVNGTKTAAAQRTIPLSTHALAALRSLPRGINGGARVFPGRTGGRFDYENWRKKEWREALEAVGLEHRSPYQMRHTFATLALQQGAAIEDVATVMGHEDIAITVKYYRKWTRPMLERFRDVLDTIDQEEDDAAANA